MLPKRNVRRIDPVQVREVIASISALGFVAPVLIDQTGSVLDGAIRVEAARAMGLSTIPCIPISHLSANEQRLLRIALNRHQEKGHWDLDTLKLEFQELMIEDIPIEVSGFSLPEIDQIVFDGEAEVAEGGPLEPTDEIPAIARPGDHFLLGDHELICGDATDPAVVAALMRNDQARLLLTDEPYNVPIAGHVTKGDHREFQMASGEMTPEEFRAFNDAWMIACLPHLCDGGIFGTFIDWRGQATVHAAATSLGLVPLNLIT